MLIKVSRREVLVLFLLFALFAGIADAQEVCVPSETNLCLEQGRFKVEVDWRSSQGNSGKGRVAPVASDSSGLFWFFNQDNWELLVKVVDGCAVNGRYWVFTSAMTDVFYSVKVTDSVTGVSKTYRKKLGALEPARTDTSAFEGCVASSSTEGVSSTYEEVVGGHSSTAAYPAGVGVKQLSGHSAGCSPEEGAACLNSSRFRVEVVWRDSRDSSGVGKVVPTIAEDSALFWFFSSENWEMLVKVLDGCALNGKFWVFSAAATDLGFDLKVTDTYTGEAKVYTSRSGQAALPVVDTEAFGACGVDGPARVEFTSGQSGVLSGAGDEVNVSVKVTDYRGRVIPDARVEWVSSDPTLVSVVRNGALSAVVTSMSALPGTAKISAHYKGAASDFIVFLVGKSVDSLLVPDEDVVEVSDGHVVLRRTTQTSGLLPGQIVVSSGTAGVLARVSQVSFAGESVELVTTPATLAEAFSDLSIGVAGAPQTVRGRLWHDGKSMVVNLSYNGKDLYGGGKAIGKVGCTVLGNPFGSVDLVSGDLYFDINLYPEVILLIKNHSVDVFRVAARGSVNLGAGGNGLRFSSQVNGTVSCAVPLGRLPLGVVPAGVFNFSLGVVASVGVEAQVSFAGTRLTVAGLSGAARGDIMGGWEYRKGGGWSPVGSRQWTGEFRPSWFEFDDAPFEATVSAFGSLEAVVSANLGWVTVAELAFMELKAGGYRTFSLAAPLDPSRKDYTGPVWEMGKSLSGGAKFEVRSGSVGKLLGRIGIESAGISLPPSNLFNLQKVDERSPGFRVEADSGSIAANGTNSLLLTGSADASSSGVLEFWKAKEGEPTLRQFVRAAFIGHSGGGKWTPLGSDVGKSDIYGRLRTDATSLVKPYASMNHLSVVVNPSGNPTESPVINSVLPNPVPASGTPQVLTVRGAGFKAGAVVRLRNISSGDSTSLTATFVNSGEVTLVASLGEVAATWMVQITNPGGSPSNELEISVRVESSSVPIISGISPSSVVASDAPQQLTINGSRFVSGLNVVLRNISLGEEVPSQSVSFLNGSQITLRHAFAIVGHTWSVEVVNPNGERSGPFQFKVVASSGSIPDKPTDASPGGTNSPGPTLASTSVTMGWSSSSGATY